MPIQDFTKFLQINQKVKDIPYGKTGRRLRRPLPGIPECSITWGGAQVQMKPLRNATSPTSERLQSQRWKTPSIPTVCNIGALNRVAGVQFYTWIWHHLQKLNINTVRHPAVSLPGVHTSWNFTRVLPSRHILGQSQQHCSHEPQTGNVPMPISHRVGKYVVVHSHERILH